MSATASVPTKRKYLCYKCVGEAFLSTEIHKDGALRRCSYCNKSRKAYTIAKMSGRVEAVLKEHYTVTPSEPDGFEYSMANDPEIDYEWERKGQPIIDVIAELAEIPQEAAEDIQGVLEEDNFDYDAAAIGDSSDFESDAYYEETGIDSSHWHRQWKRFEDSLKAEARFFNESALRILTSIFDGLASMHTSDGKALIVKGGPGTAMAAAYRARVFQSDSALMNALCYPDREIGPPPPAYARPGRMNALGISVFYGARDEKAALAEVRPPVGSSVAVAKFDIVRPVNLLDLTALRRVTIKGSLFDPAFGLQLGRFGFLRTLSEKITRPVMPDDEAFSYLVTQAIADFLATDANLNLDGILYPSVQVAGDETNIVLFHKSSRVEAIDVPPGTKISAHNGYHDEDGWETEYSVFEETPKAGAADTEEDFPVPRMMGFGAPKAKEFPPTLKVDVNSIKVHVVQAVSMTTKQYSVDRTRSEKVDLDDLGI